MDKAELRGMISEAGVKQWQIAERLGIREDALSRKLRHELSHEDELAIRDAIKMITQEKEQNANASNQAE